MKLKEKITSFVIIILLISIGSITILSFIEMKRLLRDQIDRNMINIANSFASTYEVKEYLKGNEIISNELLCKALLCLVLAYLNCCCVVCL